MVETKVSVLYTSSFTYSEMQKIVVLTNTFFCFQTHLSFKLPVLLLTTEFNSHRESVPLIILINSFFQAVLDQKRIRYAHHEQVGCFLQAVLDQKRI